MEWIQELRYPRLDLDFTRVNQWRFLLAIPILLWGISKTWAKDTPFP